jgi:hypothetical protein
LATATRRSLWNSLDSKHKASNERSGESHFEASDNLTGLWFVVNSNGKRGRYTATLYHILLFSNFASKAVASYSNSFGYWLKGRIVG